MTSWPWSSSSQISMLHPRMGKPSTGDGSALACRVSNWVIVRVKRTRWRVWDVHGLLVGDELDPALDVGHLGGRVCGVNKSSGSAGQLSRLSVKCAIGSDFARRRGGWARVVESRGLSRWWSLVANVDSARGRDAAPADN
jgi:hypothetical protein